MKAPTTQKTVILCLLTFSISVFLVGVPLVSAQDDATPLPAPEATSEVTQTCGECHIDITINWETSAHAQTFHSDEFQSALNDGVDDTCYACHTTGYTPFNGEYSHEGVACEACHGQTPANHPDEPVAVLPGLDVCASCHTTTYQEWQMSAHGSEEIPCTSCHDPHEQALRFETTQDLCLNCHQEERTDYAHVSHESEACSDCHWHRGTFDAEVHLVTGDLGTSGHDAHVETLACIDCHSNLDEVVAVAENTEPGGTELRLVTQELETEIANVRAQGENEAAVRLAQGVVVGLAFGAILAFLFIRLSPGRRVRE
jgi:predicted CXXCH cytochrome family protein